MTSHLLLFWIGALDFYIRGFLVAVARWSVAVLKIVNPFTAKSSLPQVPDYLTCYAPSIKLQLLLSFGVIRCRRIAIACHLKAEAPRIKFK